MRKWSWVVALALAVGLLGGARPAAAQTVTFDSLEVPNLTFPPGGTFVENGIRLHNESLAHWGTSDSHYAGSAGVFNNAANTLFTLDRVDGAPFSLNRINIAEIYNTGGGRNQTTVRFTGVKLDDSTVEQVFTTDGFNTYTANGVSGYETFAFGGFFSGLKRVEWQVTAAESTSTWAQFDEIVTNASDDTSAVPEPGALALFLPALAVVGILKRRRS